MESERGGVAHPHHARVVFERDAGSRAAEAEEQFRQQPEKVAQPGYPYQHRQHTSTRFSRKSFHSSLRRFLHGNGGHFELPCMKMSEGGISVSA